MNGVYKGLLLGTINVVVIAIGLAGLEQTGISGLVIIFGGLPGAIGGALLGAIGQLIDDAKVPIRIGVLALPAFGLVFLLATQFGMENAAWISCIPTLVAALILERWTRKQPEPEPVPVARVN